jgi:hypothetical protein
MSVADLRFLNFAYIPSILLLLLLTSFLERRFLNVPSSKFVFRIFVVGIIAYTCFNNFGILGKQLGHFGGMQDTIVRVERDVFESFYGKPPQGPELYLKHQELENRAVLVDWYQLPETWFEDAVEKLEKEGILYFYSRNEVPDRIKRFSDSGYRTQLWKRYNFFDAKPLIFMIFKKINYLTRRLGGKATDREIFVYVIKA